MEHQTQMEPKNKRKTFSGSFHMFRIAFVRVERYDLTLKKKIKTIWNTTNIREHSENIETSNHQRKINWIIICFECCRVQVMNVDDTGRRLCAGQLEVSDSDLILYQKGKIPVRWPLRSLRRYGFDADLFSFECGRRCPTGPGIYAFHCRRAEILFNNVQVIFA